MIRKPNPSVRPTLPIEGLDADTDLIFVRDIRTIALLGRSAKLPEMEGQDETT